MGVYIKDRDMPDTCGSCPCFHAENPMYCQAVKAAVQKPRIVHPYAKGRPEWCPLIEIQPHGRLIDADAYEKLLRGLGNRDYRREAGTLQDAIKLLHPHYAPTIIPASEEGE